MKKMCLLLVFLALFGGLTFGDTVEPEEIDYLLFLPNSSNEFVNHDQAMIQLDNLAKYLLNKDLTPGQICVYGYAAAVNNNIEPMDLSKNRALFVINELQKRGVPAEMFSDPVAYGEVNLWGNNANEKDRSPNRRVRVLLEGNLLTPAITNAAATENAATPDVTTPAITTNEEAGTTPNAAENSGFKFPWLILLLILLIVVLAILFFMLKRRKNNKSAVIQEAAPSSSPPVMEAKQEIISEPVIPPVIAPVVINYTVVNLDEEIRFRAYILSLERSWQNGDMDGDWHKAVPEVCGRYEASGHETYFKDGFWWARKAL